MRSMAMLAGLAVLSAAIGGCGGARHRAPEVRPGDFAVKMIARAYPSPAPDLQIRIWGNGSASYAIVFKAPNPGDAQGQFTVEPAQLDAIYAAVVEANFFKLDEEYIADPPMPGRGVDILVISAGGYTHEVRTEYSRVDEVEKVRSAILAALPPEAYAGGSIHRAGQKYIGNRATKLFYPSGTEEAENVPEAQRVEFATPYAALDAGYSPASAGNPFEK